MTYYHYMPNSRMLRHRMMEKMMEGLEMNHSSSGDITFPVDIEVRQDEFLLTALLPGVKPDELSIQIVNDSVTIQGEINLERDENASYLVRERPCGKFNRVFTLPATLDSEHAEANFEIGVLVLKIPKSPEARPKTIKINTK